MMNRLPALCLAVLVAVPVAAFAAQPSGYMPPVRDADQNRPTDYVPQWEPDWMTTDGAVPLNHNVSNLNGAQSETSVAIDPTDPNHIIAASNDLVTTAGLFESFDGGATWTRSTFSSSGFCYDTWCYFNAAGDAFIAYECSNQSIAYKNHGTNTWVAVNHISVAGSFPDRSMVTGDLTAGAFGGSVYIGYDDNGNNNTGYVLYSRTGKGAATWVRSGRINDSGPTIGVNAAVGPDGVVHAAWLEYGAKKLWTDKSTDGGVTWSADVKVHDYLAPTTSFFISIPPQDQRGIVLMPFSAIAQSGPFTGRYYITYTDYKPGTSFTAIYLQYSDNGGMTWSTAKWISAFNKVTYAFHPTVAVLSDGTVAVDFYVTGGAKSHKTRHLIQFSMDGGDTWGPTTLAAADLTGANSDETLNNDFNQYGDYQNITAAPNGMFGVVWTDSRLGNKSEELYFTELAPIVGAPLATTKNGTPSVELTSAAPSVDAASTPGRVTVRRDGRAMHFGFRLAEDAPTTLRVVDATGRVISELMDGMAAAGEYDVPFDGRTSDGRTLANGVYLYLLQSGGVRTAGKIVLAR